MIRCFRYRFLIIGLIYYFNNFNSVPQLQTSLSYFAACGLDRRRNRLDIYDVDLSLYVFTAEPKNCRLLTSCNTVSVFVTCYDVLLSLVDASQTAVDTPCDSPVATQHNHTSSAVHLQHLLINSNKVDTINLISK